MMARDPVRQSPKIETLFHVFFRERVTLAKGQAIHRDVGKDLSLI